jgi:hypothetical protein
MHGEHYNKLLEVIYRPSGGTSKARQAGPEQLFRFWLTHLEVEEERFDGRQIRRLYEGEEFPLTRRATA